MRVFIVHAHHEKASFNSAMTQRACQTFRNAGHEVLLSDLYAEGFDPVSDRRNFRTVKESDYLKQQVEENYASEHDGFAPDIRRELERLEWCDLLIFQFPLWWFGLPGILKGWVDRVFAMGRVYGGGKWYEDGAFRGKKALLSLTTGGPSTMYGPDGLNGHMKDILFPIHHGIFWFTGFQVHQPHVVWGPARLSPEQRAQALQDYESKLLGLESAPLIHYPPVSQHGSDMRDRFSRFMVRFYSSGHPSSDLTSAEQEALDNHRREHRLLTLDLAQDGSGGWMVWRSPDRATLETHLGQLPQGRFGSLEIQELARAQA